MIGLVPLYRYGELDGLSFVDWEDFPKTQGRSWQRTGEGYAVGFIDGRGSYPLHRFILGLAPGDRVCHHINEIKADNRRTNLRVCASVSEAQRQPHPKANARQRAYALGGRAA